MSSKIIYAILAVDTETMAVVNEAIAPNRDTAERLVADWRWWYNEDRCEVQAYAIDPENTDAAIDFVVSNTKARRAEVSQ